MVLYIRRTFDFETAECFCEIFVYFARESFLINCPFERRRLIYSMVTLFNLKERKESFKWYLAFWWSNITFGVLVNAITYLVN